MKKFNLLILFTVLIYLLIALWAGYEITVSGADRSQYYKVEVNRLYESLSKGIMVDKLDLRSFQYIQNVTVCSAEELKNKNTAKEFYEEKNKAHLVIKPLFEDEEWKGLVRFDINEPMLNTQSIFTMVQIILGVMELFVLGILFYLKYKFLTPFERMSNVPEALAKGHLKGVIKEEKNQYFSRFLWGISLLKDNLAVSRKRELELLREKKRLLLSLSHDIKTPLNTIKLYSQALEKHLYQNEDDRKRAAHQIGEKTNEIEGYLSQIIKSSREDIIDFQVVQGEFYLDELLRRVLDTYKEASGLRMLELTVTEYENILLKGDLERAIEVMENVFENAFKYGDGRKIEITFSQEDYCQLIRIYNTGTVLNNTEFNHIFESFFRGSNVQGKPGHGLGLFICREIMQKMGGEIFAQQEEQGMAFVLVFKL